MLGIENAKSDDPDKVKSAILKIGSFNGINETFNIDAYGDNNRQYMLYILKDKEFVVYKDQ
ncbi:MAG: hypothetical protein JXR88_11725 [Clostridia bacterium]|nr:hypothetical protein [Clostridia bacterium]